MASLRLLGGGYFDGLDGDGVTELAVPVAAGHDRLRSSAEVPVLRSAIDERDVVVVHGVRCLRPHPALFDEMRRTGDLRVAVVAADMAAAALLVTIAGMRAYSNTRVGDRGLWLVLDALGLAVDHSWSPMETRLRLIWVLDARWERPLCNPAVLDASGRLIGHPDLLDPRRGIRGEFNGADHRGRERYRRDVIRDDRFRQAGLEDFTLVGDDIRNVSLVVERMEAARARAGRLPQTWMLDGGPFRGD